MLPAEVNKKKTSANLKNSRKVKQEELRQTEILLINRVEMLELEMNHLNDENQTKTNRTSELERENKVKKMIFSRKMCKISLLRKKKFKS